MALKDINVSALRGSLNACFNSINNSYTTDIVTSLSGDSSWSGQAKNNLKTAIDTLTNTRYSELKDKLEEYLSVADTIEEYQTIYNEMIELNEELTSKKTSLNLENNKINKDSTTINTLTTSISTLQDSIAEKETMLMNIENSLVIE